MNPPCPNIGTNANPTRFVAYAEGDLALVRIVGPGVCRESGRFETLLRDVMQRGFSRLVLDLTECPRMDSTFVGAVLRLADQTLDTQPAHPPLRAYVANPSPAVHDLLDTLCLNDLLPTVPLPAIPTAQEVALNDDDLQRTEILALSVDAHERLSRLTPENARRFSGVLAALRAELDTPSPPVSSRPS
jgi:anti-anti-sigma regulatory factor